MASKNKHREAGSGSVTKRADGRWQGQYTSGRDPKTGKLRRHTIYGKTQKEVAEKLRAVTSSRLRHTPKSTLRTMPSIYPTIHRKLTDEHLTIIFFRRSARSN